MKHKRDERRSKKNTGSRSSGSNERSGPPSKGGRFVFKDRTGKVHGPGGRDTVREPERAPRPAKESHFKKKRPEGGHRKERPRTREREFKQDREAETLRATVDKNRKGFGFLQFDSREFEDAFIPPREAERLFHGDRVEVTINSRGDVINIQVLEHRFRELVGRFSPHLVRGTKSGFVVYERKRAREEIFVPEMTGDAKSGDWVRARLVFHEKGPFPVTAEVVEVFGAELPAAADVSMIAAEYNLIEEHSAAADEEARGHRLEIPGKDLTGREDLRKVPFITIDGETARDFDDAVYVERSRSGFVLWVAIADVSHYVKPGSALDDEARSRGTSVYFPERAFHMLPSALSTGLCSLRPYEPRLSMVAKITFDRHAKHLNTELMEAVIESHRRATYNEMQAEREQNLKNPDWTYSPHFELYEALRKMRSDRGSIDFELPEAEVLVDDNGEVLSIENRARLDAHRLIEEFMIAANEAVTEWIMSRGWPFVFRVHEEPAAQALERFESIAATVGIKLSLSKGEVSPKILADVVRRVEGHPAQDLLNMSLLRSMKRAIYSSTHGVHYGLASGAYTHFTSPIRRYPDLVVHRLLRWALRVEKKSLPALKKSERDELEKELEDICEHCSYRERLASDADREAIRLKQVRLMHRHLGDEFAGKVIGMADAGLFIQLDAPYVEGMIPKESMTDDLYEYNEDQMIFAGRRKKRTFKIGDRVRIQVVRADMDRRQVDFSLLEHSKPEARKI